MDDNTKNIIQNHIDNNDVCLFMKGTPDAPQCGFSMAVSNMLKILEVNFKGVIMDESTKNIIQEHIDNNEVCLFMKGTPDAPQCGFSMAVSNILKFLEVNFKGVNVLEDQNIREGIKVYSDWPTIPQLYIKKEFVGGCDIVKEMYENGELKKVLEDKGINFKN
jgi:monothiol glutaredoxin